VLGPKTTGEIGEKGKKGGEGKWVGGVLFGWRGNKRKVIGNFKKNY